MSPLSKNRIKRFSPTQRIFHVLLMLCFLTQGATGLARISIETVWGQRLSWIFGGYESALKVHIGLGIFMIFGFLIHAVCLLFKINWKNFPQSLFSPDSLLPNLRDVKDFFQHIFWFLGLAKAPQFDRWGYWEKFDHWAVFWGMVVMGGTGLLMAYPLVSTQIMPGWGLNVVFWIHRIEAMLAMAHVFIIHFFIAHLRRRNFPMDRTMFEGSADVAVVRREKPAWIERLKKNGDLDRMLVDDANPCWRTAYYIFGYTVLTFGVFLLIGAIVNLPYITW